MPEYKDSATRGICRHALEGRRDGWYGVRVADTCPRKVRVHGIAMVPYTRCNGCPYRELQEQG